MENRLGDLWSLFDFINPGLLGIGEGVHKVHQTAGGRPVSSHGPLRDLVRPYILRRLKTDKSIIADLPDKTEMKAFCPLTRTQAALYQQAVTELAEQLETADGIERKGLVLAYLMRFKQICNHPSQWLGDGAVARGGQRQIGAPARNRRSGRREAGKNARVHAVPRDHGAAGRLFSARYSNAPAWCCTARPR